MFIPLTLGMIVIIVVSILVYIDQKSNYEKINIYNGQKKMGTFTFLFHTIFGKETKKYEFAVSVKYITRMKRLIERYMHAMKQSVFDLTALSQLFVETMLLNK